jgi:hypothetical protein
MMFWRSTGLATGMNMRLPGTAFCGAVRKVLRLGSDQIWPEAVRAGE